MAFIEIKQDILFYLDKNLFLKKILFWSLSACMLYANVFWISGRTYLVCQFNDRWLIFNYSVTLSSGIFFCYILYISTIEFYQTSRELKEL